MQSRPDADVSIESSASFERRYLAVLVADVVGYSRLMEAAEMDTFTRYRALRVDVIDPDVVSHRGEIIKNTGDGFIAIFESPIDGLRCAIQLQQDISAKEVGEPPERRIQFRIGIHWEPVIFENNDVFGSAVNIADRLQTAAPPGGVVVSHALLEQIESRTDIKADDLGDIKLKNMSRPVHAFSLRLPGVERSAALGAGANPAGWARLPSIAILPFTNLSSEPGDNYFADGLIEDIILTLSHIPELFVVSRGSTIAFRRRSTDPESVSEKLGVRYVLNGTVRRSGDQLRLSVQLTDVATSSVIWAEKYEVSVAEVFLVQDEIAVQIVGKIATHVRKTEIRRALRKSPENLNAYDYLLRALDLLYRLDFGSFSQARALLEKACEEDDAYAAPYAFLAHWHIFNIGEGWSTDSDADGKEMIRLSTCAIERDPANALALAIQGHGRAMFYRDYDAALSFFDRAIAQSPNSSWAWMFSSGAYGFIGQAGAGVERAERAIRLSPLDQQAFFNLCFLAQNHYLNDSFDESIRWARKALYLNPRIGVAARMAAASLVALGRHDEARSTAELHGKVLPGFRLSDYERRCPFKQPAASVYVERLKIAGITV